MMYGTDGVIEAVEGGRVNPGPWTVVEKVTRREPRGAMCLTGTEGDAKGTAIYWNKRAGYEKYEATLKP
jgi:hypothetical protein